MDLLRWILLGIGLVVVAAVWYQGRKRRALHEESLFERARRMDPDTDSGPEPTADSRSDATAQTDEDLPDFDIDPDEFDHLVEQRPRNRRESSGRDTPPTVESVHADERHHSREPWQEASEAADGSEGERATLADEPEQSVHIDEPVDESEDANSGSWENWAERDPDAESSAWKRWNPLESSIADAARERLRRGLGRKRQESETDEARGTADGGSRRDTDERIVVLYVIAADAERLSGAALAATFRTLGLEFGQYGIFHRFGDSGEPIFSVANVVEPGTFEPERMADTSTPGVAFFARLPGPVSSPEAFDEMVGAARALATELDARLLDADRSTLTRQTEQHLRDDLREYDHRRRRMGL